MRSRTVGLLCVLATACSYDWSVGLSATDGGEEAGSSLDASDDAPATGDDAALHDASEQDATGQDASEHDVLAQDAIEQDSPGVSCSALEMKIQQDKPPAIACTSGPSACTTTVLDECGCKLVVGDGMSTATATYQGAVAQFTQAQCPHPWCPASCPTPNTGLCLVTDASANQYACQQ